MPKDTKERWVVRCDDWTSQEYRTKEDADSKATWMNEGPVCSLPHTVELVKK